LSRLGYSTSPGQGVGLYHQGAIFGVLLGGRLGYTLYDLHNFLRNPLIFPGDGRGNVGSRRHRGPRCSLWCARRHELSWRNVGDNLVVAAPISCFSGVGNSSARLWRVANVPWAVQFPKGSTKPRRSELQLV
jgi:hypothetical protein